LHLHGAGGVRLSPAHDLLAEKFRVIAIEMPGFGGSAENTRTRDLSEMAATIGRAADAIGLGTYNVMGTSFGARVALWLALQQGERIQAVVLDAPAAIRPEGTRPPDGTPAEMAARLYAHPERMPPFDPAPLEVQQQQQRLVTRLRGPARDADLERRLADLATPVLVVFGTRDAVIPPEMGRHYKAVLPNCHLVFVYDAGHAIGAERPEAFVELAGDFLERREAFVISRTETMIHP